ATVAYRGAHRWTQIFEPVRLGQDAARRARLREGGVYLLTGGLRELDLALAERLVEKVKAKLILTGRMDIPERADWQQWVSTHSEEEETSRKISRLLALETSGAEIFVRSADITNYGEMRSVI